MLCKGSVAVGNTVKKKIIALLLAAVFLVGAFADKSINRIRPFESDAKASTGAIFLEDKFICSGTEIGHTRDGGGVFLTARHCIADVDTNEIRKNLTVSFAANQEGPFYVAEPIALSLSDDLALLYLVNGAEVPPVAIRDERRLYDGEQIFNVSFPLGTGKEMFHGEYIQSRFPALPAEIEGQYTQWMYSMPINLTIAHGSSGSGVFSKRQHALVGVAVGTFEEGSYNIAIPADRVLDFLNDLKDNTVAKYAYANPVREAPMWMLFFRDR